MRSGPKIRHETPLDRTVRGCVQAQEKAEIVAAAAGAGQSESQWVREAVLAKLGTSDDATEAQERAHLESEFAAAPWWLEDPPDLEDTDAVVRLAGMLPVDTTETYSREGCCIRWGGREWKRLNDGNAIGAALLYIRASEADQKLGTWHEGPPPTDRVVLVIDWLEAKHVPGAAIGLCRWQRSVWRVMYADGDSTEWGPEGDLPDYRWCELPAFGGGA